MVNLHNLIAFRTSSVPIKRFTNEAEFRKYTLNSRVFPLWAAKEDGFIQTLLRKVV